jgi:hypothetical protein
VHRRIGGVGAENKGIGDNITYSEPDGYLYGNSCTYRFSYSTADADSYPEA